MGHGGRPETLAEPDLIVLGQMLIPEEDNQTLVPCIQNLRKYLIAHRFAQINTRDFGANSLEPTAARKIRQRTAAM